MTRQLTNLAKRFLPFGLRLRLRDVNRRRMYLQEKVVLPKGAESVYCPIAEQEFATFLKKGSDLLTPSNGARARHRLIWLYLDRRTDLFRRPQRLLHVAPEVCLMPRLAAVPGLEYVPGDKMVKGYGTQGAVTYLDLLDIDYPDAHFDFVLCNHVLEHIPDDGKAMTEMYRVLRPGGTLLVTVPINESLEQTYENPDVTDARQREEHFGQWDHVRYYGMDIADRLRAVGFAVSMERYGEAFETEEYRRYGLNQDLLVLCRK